MRTIAEMDDIQAVKIRHRGPCPKEKGHAVDTGWLAFAAGVYVMMMIAMAWSAWVLPDYKGEALKRGYATYNSTTGQFQWR
jgi:hypothetical protein